MARVERVLLCAGAACLVAACTPGGARRPDVLLVTLDTTRADHLGFLGYGRGTSPFLDRLARESLVFPCARSTSSWTLPAHASLFTGLFPHEHGVRYDASGPLSLEDAIDEGARTADGRPYRVRGLDQRVPTLAEELCERGYATAAVVAGPWLMHPFGMDRGFAHHDERDITSDAGRRATSVTDAAIEWLNGRDPERPFFLFVNYFDPHAPYAAPGSPPDGGEDPVAAYDAEIAYMDRELGRLLLYLRGEGLHDAALIVVTGDHGELLGERGRWGHGRWLDEALLRVPLVCKLPGAAVPRRSEAAVQLPDVHDLILGVSDGLLPREAQRSLEELVRARGGHALAEVWPAPDAPELGRWIAVVEGRHKLLFSPTSGRSVLFDLETDPAEERDVSASAPATVRRLQAGVRTPGSEPGGAPIEIEGEALERLRALGYLGG